MIFFEKKTSSVARNIDIFIFEYQTDKQWIRRI